MAHFSHCEKTIVVRFLTVLVLVTIATKFKIKGNSFAELQQNCRIASMTLYLCKNEAENPQMAMSIKFLTFDQMGYLENHLAH